MNGLLIVALLLAAASVGAVVWALRERRRADAAELRIEVMRESSELVTAQLTQSATGVAEAILKKNEEAIHNREQLSQARLEAQLKPVAETLQKFQEQVTLAEKARAEETGGLKEQIAALLTASTAPQDEARQLSAAL